MEGLSLVAASPDGFDLSSSDEQRWDGTRPDGCRGCFGSRQAAGDVPCLLLAVNNADLSCIPGWMLRLI